MKIDDFIKKTKQISDTKSRIAEEIAEIKAKKAVVDDVMTGEYDDDVAAAIARVEQGLDLEDDTKQKEAEELNRRKEKLQEDIREAIREYRQAIGQMQQLSDTRYGGQFAEVEQETRERVAQLEALLDELDSLDGGSAGGEEAFGGIVSRVKAILGIGEIQQPAPISAEDQAAMGADVVKQLTNLLSNKQVQYNPIRPSGTVRTQEEIVRNLAGDDQIGCCSSLAFAYIGNKAGYHVQDFRGGESQKIFSSRMAVRKIASLPGVQSTLMEGFNEVSCAKKLLDKMTPGKEYYLATGEHAAIVRRSGSGYEFLELQDSYSYGWYPLDTADLVTRFHCHFIKNRLSALIDVDSLSGNTDFLQLLGYINTDSINQIRG